MNDLTFLSKVSKANVKVDYDNLLTTFLQFPLTEIRGLENLDTVLSCPEIPEFTDAYSLIFFIEKKSRELDVSKARSLQAQIKKQYEEKLLIEAEQKRKEEKLLKSILKFQGLDGNREECISCGFVPAANGHCKC
tara:strand:- start:793 stop:1197 length:405 start_codon:yes stop_codon:yes gene_type:complete